MPDDPAAPLVLLVEDFDDAREMYRDYLVFAGFRVETAVNGYDAIRRTLDLLPDVVLMDLSIPGLDGWEATRRLKADPRTAGVPVIALSAHALAADGQRAREAGCDGFIAKPCLPPDLANQINMFLASRPSGARGRRPGARRPS